MPDRFAWQADVDRSEVRLQWDPDDDPAGKPVVRRAVQLGLRGEALARYAKEWIRGIEDLTPLVRAQHSRMGSGGFSALEPPLERVYPDLPSSQIAAAPTPQR